MADTEVIKEFLVALGFKIDETDGKKFNDALTVASKNALKMGGAVMGVVSALEAFVDQVAAGVESLYFMSQRTGAAIANIHGFQYAATQLGGSAEAAATALENMGAFLRNNPASESYLNSLKVQTRDVNGQLLDTTVIMGNLGKQLAQMPNYQAKAFGDFFHIDERTLLALKSGEYTKWIEDHNARLKEAGLDMADLGVKAHDYEDNWRRLKDEAGIFGDKLGSIAIGPATDLLKLSEKTLENYMSSTTAADRVKAGHYKGFWDYLEKRGTGGALMDLISQTNHQAWEATKIVGGGVYTGFGNIFGGTESGGAGGPTVASDQEARIMSRLEGMGWTQAQAAGIMANLKAESGYNPAAVGDNGEAYGAGQWHADRQALFKQFAGHDIRQSTLDEQLEFLNWELRHNEAAAGGALSSSSTARDAAYAMTGYERPRDFAGQAALRGAEAERINANAQGDVTVHQTTNITVHGAGDAHGTAQAVAREQATVNQGIARNVAGVVN